MVFKYIKRHKGLLAGAAAGALVFFVAGWFSGERHGSGDVASKIIRIREDSSYKYINPLLAVDVDDKEEFRALLPVQNQVSKYIKTALGKGDAKSVSVYLRNLVTGEWTGINENELYAPASMLKVATLIAYLKLAEQNPAILSNEFYYDGREDKNLRAYFKPSTSLASGMHTVDELLGRMIEESGNNSDYLLKSHIKIEDLARVYDQLHLPVPQSDSDDDFMSPKSYSLVFRILYNSTYLSREMSEKALELLSRTTFDRGLALGIDKDLTIADKFGERTLVDTNGEVVGRELHDCGIVYLPGRPYFICVMTKGEDFEKLTGVIAGISKLVFAEMKAGD